MPDVSANTSPPLKTAPPPPATPFRVFISYAREDEKYLIAFSEHLSSLTGSWIEIWTDRILPLGVKWEPALLNALETADVILLLVSRHFLASGYIQRVELKRAFERFAAGQVLIVPILVSDVYLPDESEILQFTVLPQNLRPVTGGRQKQDRAWTGVARDLHGMLKKAELARRERAAHPTSSGIPAVGLWEVVWRSLPGAAQSVTEVSRSAALMRWLEGLKVVPLPWYVQFPELAGALAWFVVSVLGVGALWWFSPPTSEPQKPPPKEQAASSVSRGGADRAKAPELVSGVGAGTGTGRESPLEAKAETPPTAAGADIPWISIPGGSFMMGSEDIPNARPVHKVTVPSFQMSKTEVTVAQYRACVQDGKCTEPGLGETCNWSKSDRDNHPINCVDWDQARTFASWAGGRLPSEAEWEYAARGKEGRKYPWGNTPEPSCGVGVIGGCSREAHAVCSKEKGNTPTGLCDMGGNVWELMEDCFEEGYKNAPNNGDEQTTCIGVNTVIRGGSWTDDASDPRGAFRHWAEPWWRPNNLGIRIARSRLP